MSSTANSGLVTDSIGQASTAQTDNSSLPSPVLKTEPINYDYMPEEMFQDAT